MDPTLLSARPRHAAGPVPRARTMLALAAALLLAACGGGASQAPARMAPPAPPRAVSPMNLGGQPVLVLPVQALDGVQMGQEPVTAEILFALTEHDERTRWIGPEDLRRALRRSPGYAADPAFLPNDPYRRHGDRYIAGALAGVVRRYAALVDARLVMIPRSARFLPAADSTSLEGVVRIDAAVVDSRTGAVLWYGEAEGSPGLPDDPATVRSAAAMLAARMVAPSGM